MAFLPQELVVPWVASNVLALALVAAAYLRPRAASWALAALFAAAAVVNVLTVLRAPGAYVEGFAPSAVPLYRSFITGPFARHELAFVSTIAAGQALVAALLLARPSLARIGAAGAVGFLLAIAPLGVGSAFPAPLTMAVAVVVMAVRRRSRAPSPPVRR